MKHEDLVRRLRELSHTKTGRAVKPPDGTRWVCRVPDNTGYVIVMANGKVMVEPHDGRKGKPSWFTVEELRSRPDIFTEIPPAKGTP